MPYTPGERLIFSKLQITKNCTDCPPATGIIAAGLAALSELKKQPYAEPAPHFGRGTFTIARTRHEELMAVDEQYRQLAETYSHAADMIITIYNNCPGATANQTLDGAVYNCRFPAHIQGGPNANS